MAEHEGDPETELEGRLRTSLAIMAPPATSTGVLEGVQRRVARRRRRVRETIGAALVVLVGGGTVAGLALTSSPHLAASPPAHVTTVPSSTTPTRSPSAAADGNPSSAARDIQGLGRPAPEAPPCQVGQSVPSMDGRFCGPAPGPGSGLGPSGECTGNETSPPCGPGVIPGQFYAYTVPGTCNGLMTFDGKQWVSELPPPNPVPDFDVWIQLSAGGSVGWIAPIGAVGLQPYVGQTLTPCRG